jgi:hypothetical protein
MTKLVEFRVQVTRIDDTGKPEDDADHVDVLDVRVEVPVEYVPTVGYGAATRDEAGPPQPLALQLQIRAALEAARPGS